MLVMDSGASGSTWTESRPARVILATASGSTREPTSCEGDENAVGNEPARQRKSRHAYGK